MPPLYVKIIAIKCVCVCVCKHYILFKLVTLTIKMFDERAYYILFELLTSIIKTIDVCMSGVFIILNRLYIDQS